MADKPLRIVHCFRSSVGGIFRHVRDLAQAQAADGHLVGIVCDANTGAEHEDRLFDDIRPNLALGMKRVPMRRAINPGDLLALWRAYRETSTLAPDILHAHGAKGGAYARLIGTAMRFSGHRVARLYCPHGGSIHYAPEALKSKIYFALERLLEPMTDRLLFVSKYERDGYAAKVGVPRCSQGLIYNGLADDEFEPISLEAGHRDFLYIGMMRDLKGPDLFIAALEIASRDLAHELTAHMVGDGPDKAKYVADIRNRGMENQIMVHDAMRSREAFAKARTVVVPSRAESMPYIVLEAIAAARPIIATNVGGIPEIFANEPEILVTPDNPAALAKAMVDAYADKDFGSIANQRAAALKKRFGVAQMAQSVLDHYRQVQAELER